MPKILIFEDDTMIASMYVTKYKMEGFDVVAFTDPSKDPVSIVLREKPDIISMDITMPIMTGWDAIVLLKSDYRTKNIPIVILSNLGDQKDVERGIGIGAADYMVKAHYTPQEVVDRCRKILGLPVLPEKPIPPPGEAWHGPTVGDMPPDQAINAKIQKSWWKRLFK